MTIRRADALRDRLCVEEELLFREARFTDEWRYHAWEAL